MTATRTSEIVSTSRDVPMDGSYQSSATPRVVIQPAKRTGRHRDREYPADDDAVGSFAGKGVDQGPWWASGHHADAEKEKADRGQEGDGIGWHEWVYDRSAVEVTENN